MRLPFSVYDFFAYLASGFVVIMAVDVALGGNWMVNAPLALWSSVLIVVVAYIVGHVVAHLSSMLFEQWLVARLLGRPSETLFGRTPRWRSLLFPGYYRTLPATTQARIVEAARGRSFDGTGEALFLHAYSIVTAAPARQERLDSFRNLYGFSRNIALALLAAAIILIIGDGAHTPDWIPGAVLIAAIVMFYRYLKFFRQYSYQLFISYAESSEEG